MDAVLTNVQLTQAPPATPGMKERGANLMAPWPEPRAVLGLGNSSADVIRRAVSPGPSLSRPRHRFPSRSADSVSSSIPSRACTNLFRSSPRCRVWADRVLEPSSQETRSNTARISGRCTCRGRRPLLTLSLPSSKGTFSIPFREKCISEVVRMGSIISHLSEL